MRSFIKSTIILFLLPILLSYSQIDSVVISEVMFYPSVSNSEFIELYNPSKQNSVDLSKYQIIYYTSNADTIITINGEMNLSPNSFAVIFEGDYDIANGVYSTIVPENTLNLKIQDNAFGSSGMANTSDRILYLVNSEGDTIDVYVYSANNSSGISDEKIILNDDSTSSNWSNSLVFNGTPGKVNSVSSREYDLSITDLYYSPAEIFEGQEVQFSAVVKNIGMSPTSMFSVQIYVDLNSDSLAQQSEILTEQNFESLAPGDSIIFTGSSTDIPYGNYSLFAIANYDMDQNLSNNIFYLDINVYPKLNKYGDIVLSEIMFAPTDNEPEWVEIYNLSDSTINLNNWRIEDRSSSVKISDTTFFIQPNEFVVLTGDESIYNYYNIGSPVRVINLPSLNNSDENLKLLDSLKRTIDSVYYSSEWGGNEGYSLEKIQLSSFENDSTNWGTSINPFGGTPGKENSLTPKLFDLAISEFLLSGGFVVIGESAHLNIEIKNLGTSASTDFKLQIFNDKNSDSLAQEDEIIYESNQMGINPGDSLLFSIESFDFDEGRNRYISKLIYEEDLDPDNNTAYLIFTALVLNEVRNDIIINEIMYY